MFSLNEAVKPLPAYQTNKYPLQRIVQILKRHRDMAYGNHEHRPISIIITTLAAKAYRGQPNIYEALLDVIDRMPDEIETRYDDRGNPYKFIGNPAIPEGDENFADKWVECKSKEDIFFDWLKQVKADIQDTSYLRGPLIQEKLSKVFGKAEVSNTFVNIGERKRILTEQGANRLDPKLGIAAGAAQIIKPHNFYGSED